MITKKRSRISGYVQVVFELPSCIWTDHICLTGDFNQWQPHSLPLLQGHDGVWRIVLELPGDRCFEFRYLVDDHWLTDSHADGIVSSPYGTQNSIVDTTIPLLWLQFEPVIDQVSPLWWQNVGRELQATDRLRYE